MRFSRVSSRCCLTRPAAAAFCASSPPSTLVSLRVPMTTISSRSTLTSGVPWYQSAGTRPATQPLISSISLICVLLSRCTYYVLTEITPCTRGPDSARSGPRDRNGGLRRRQRAEQVLGDARDRVDRRLERVGVLRRGLLHPAHLAYELPRGGAGLIVTGAP